MKNSTRFLIFLTLVGVVFAYVFCNKRRLENEKAESLAVALNQSVRSSEGILRTYAHAFAFRDTGDTKAISNSQDVFETASLRDVESKVGPLGPNQARYFRVQLARLYQNGTNLVSLWDNRVARGIRENQNRLRWEDASCVSTIENCAGEVVASQTQIETQINRINAVKAAAYQRVHSGSAAAAETNPTDRLLTEAVAEGETAARSDLARELAERKAEEQKRYAAAIEELQTTLRATSDLLGNYFVPSDYAVQSGKLALRLSKDDFITRRMNRLELAIQSTGRLPQSAGTHLLAAEQTAFFRDRFGTIYNNLLSVFDVLNRRAYDADRRTPLTLELAQHYVSELRELKDSVENVNSSMLTERSRIILARNTEARETASPASASEPVAVSNSASTQTQGSNASGGFWEGVSKVANIATLCDLILKFVEYIF